MIIIYDKSNVAYFIRPCPLINITWNGNYNENGQVGGNYDIVLTGSLLDNHGSPIFSYNSRGNANLGVTWASTYDPRPGQQYIADSGALGAILSKQIALRELFSLECAKMEVCDLEGSPIITLYPKFESINFAEGIWVHKCDYTVNLTAPFLLDTNEKIIGSNSYSSDLFEPGSPGWPDNNPNHRIDIPTLLNKVGGFVDDFQESWSIEPEEGNANTFDPYGSAENYTRIYRLTRNISAKGKDLSSYKCFGTEQNKSRYKAHEQARAYVHKYIHNSGTTIGHFDDYPYVLNATNPLQALYGSGAMNLSVSKYGGFNHSRTENVDVTQGTYSIQDTWILSSGNAYENYNLSLSNNISDARNRVTIDGTIKGLTSIPASGSVFGGDSVTSFNTSYENAINKYRQITNDGAFGINAWVYKRAQNAAGGFKLNHVPLAVTLGSNEINGEITYSIEFDDRPSNIVEGVISENINVTDTYPGDVFSVIPVIGRPTGPVLQYIGGRTEYQRSLSIELVVASPSGTRHRDLLLKKPSLVNPTRTGILEIIREYSPGKEPGIRKYFASPPQETWDPKEGRYSFNVTWTYELNY